MKEKEEKNDKIASKSSYFMCSYEDYKNEILSVLMCNSSFFDHFLNNSLTIKFKKLTSLLIAQSYFVIFSFEMLKETSAC